jgi:REP element-mobilizing transposase RayT
MASLIAYMAQLYTTFKPRRVGVVAHLVFPRNVDIQPRGCGIVQSGYNAGMPNYIRALRPGGTIVLTRVTKRRVPIFAGERARMILRKAFDGCRRFHPFVLDAIVLLPDPLHMLITLAEGDASFSVRVRHIKSTFTREYLMAGGLEQRR